jgi:hypothetical protein
MYELRYIEELYPVQKASTLQDGSDYHSGIERYYREGDFETDMSNPKISAMVRAYINYVAENFPMLKEVKYCEEWFDHKLTQKHSIIGRCDAVALDGLPVEHKTTSAEINEDYEYALQWDEQVLTYMLAKGVTEMYYTVIRKPTIRQKQNETEEEFYERCFAWYAEDTERKIKVLKVTRSPQEIAEHRESLKVIAKEIEGCKHFYRNPCMCNAYGRRCEYESVCLNYNPELEYIEFEKKKRVTEENENELF